MSRKWITRLIMSTGITILLVLGTVPGYAQEPTPANDANCIGCHEHEYYVYDSGKWFCLCDAPMHCVYCHGGRTDSLEKEVAHEGLVLYPTQDHANRCQLCHDQDYLSRVATFASIAGISSTSQPISMTPSVEHAAIFAKQQSAAPLIRLRLLEPWRLSGLGALAIVFLITMVFGYRCYKADCLLKDRR